MKAKFYGSMVLLFLMSLVGCKDTPDVPPTPIDPVDTPDFVIEVKATTDDSVEFTITPADEEMTYVAMMTTKEYFDKFEDDEAYILDDLMWLDNAAYEAGVELSEYLEGVLKKGVISDTQDKLDPATEYIVYAFGLSTQGIVTTKLYKQEFTTLATELIDLSFEIKVSNIDYDSATVSVKPDDKKAIYFVNVLSEGDYNHFGGDENAFVEHLTTLRNYYYGMGATAEQMVANLCYVGDKQIEVEKLKAGTKYKAYAIGVDDRFIANSVATVVEFETPTATQADLTFEVDITEVFYDHIEGKVTPSNNEDSYICSIQLANALEWYDSDEEFMESIITDITYWGSMEDSLRTGEMSLDGVAGLQPETNYVVVCFGYDGAPTTAPHITHFTTTAATGNPDELVVEFEVNDITHNSANVTTIPSVGVYYFTSVVREDYFDLLIDDYASVDERVAYLANSEIDYGAEWFECSRAEYLYEVGACVGKYTSMFNQLEPSTDYIAYAVAVDLQTGELASENGFVSDVFRTLDKVASEAKVEFVLGNYYDGSALAELDPARFLNCKGYAVLPYTIEPNDSAAAWYTGFYESDFTEWGCTDDDIYAELITWGWECDSEYVSENRESGIAVLSYDMPYTFLGIAQDMNGDYGEGTLEVVTLTRDGVSPAEEYIVANPSAAPVKAVKSHRLAR